MNQTCKNCRHSRDNREDLLGRTLMCFRNPPTVFPVVGANGGVGVMLLRPQVNDVDSACGEFSPKQETTQ
jgi:hypothetical protein